VVADSWMALSRIAAAARATTMTAKHAATKLRIVVLQFEKNINGFNKLYKLRNHPSAGFGGRNAIYAPLSLPQITLGEVLGDRAALPYAK